jgi:hypothetical protein
MQLTIGRKTALAGAIWFAAVASVSFPWVVTALDLLRPRSTTEVVGLSLVFAGLPAALGALMLANRIARASSLLGTIGAAVLLVLVTQAITAVLLAFATFHQLSLSAIVAQAFGLMVTFLLFNVVSYGLPLVVGAVASVVFREAVRRSSWL